MARRLTNTRWAEMDQSGQDNVRDLWKVFPEDQETMSVNISSLNSTLPPALFSHNAPALIFGVLLIIVIICGNVLVCLSVYQEKALKTTTNYFIVSLAVADLLLAVLVLPLFVYAEVRDACNYWIFYISSFCNSQQTQYSVFYHFSRLRRYILSVCSVKY